MPPTRRAAATSAADAGINPVFAAEYLTGTSKKGDLVKRLQSACATLRALTQVEPSLLPPGLDNIAAAVVTPALVQHSNKEVASWVACVCVEVLRLYAPDAPYSPNQLLVRREPLMSRARIVPSRISPMSLQDVFRLLLEQLPRVHVCVCEDALERTLHENARHVLASLHDVRSYCILSTQLLHTDASVPGSSRIRASAEECVIALVHTLVAGAGSGTDRAVVDQIADITVQLFDDLDAVSENILMPLFRALVERGPQEPAHVVAAVVLNKLESKLAIHVGSTVNAMLAHAAVAATSGKSRARASRRGDVDAESDADGASGHEDDDAPNPLTAGGPAALISREDLHTLILRLAGIIPSSMVVVLPNICLDLESDHLEQRAAAMTLCGRLFQQQPVGPAESAGGKAMTPLAVEYAVQFDAWTRRFRDKEARIRTEMCKLAGEIINAYEQLAPALLSHLEDRTRDADDSVRRAAVGVICDRLCSSFRVVTDGALNAVAERLHDKTFDVRRDAATGLAQVYAAHVAPIWSKWAAHVKSVGVAEAPAAASAPTATKSGKRARPATQSIVADPLPVPLFQLTSQEESALSMMRWIPSRVIACYEHVEMDMRVRVAQLVDCIFLQESTPEDCRAAGLIHIYADLSPAARVCFWKMQSDRQRTQSAVRDMVNARSSLRSAELADEAADIVQLREALLRAIAVVVERTGGGAKNTASVLTLLSCIADQRVYRLLLTLSDYNVGIEELKRAREDLTSRLKAAAASMHLSAAERSAKIVALLGTAAAAPYPAAALDMAAVQELVRATCRKMMMCTLSPGILQSFPLFCDYLYRAGARDRALLEAGLTLLKEASRLWPRLLAGASAAGSSGLQDIIQVLFGLAESGDAAIAVPSLRALYFSAPSIASGMTPQQRDTWRSLLLRLAGECQDIRTVKHSVRVGAALFGACWEQEHASAVSADDSYITAANVLHADTFFTRLISSVHARLFDDDVSQLLPALAAASALAREQPGAFQYLDDRPADASDLHSTDHVTVPAALSTTAAPAVQRLGNAMRRFLLLAERAPTDISSTRRIKPRVAARPARSNDAGDDDDKEEETSDDDDEFRSKKRRGGAAAKEASAQHAGDTTSTSPAPADDSHAIAAQLRSAKRAFVDTAPISGQLRARAIDALASVATGYWRVAQLLVSNPSLRSIHGNLFSRGCGAAIALVGVVETLLTAGGDLERPLPVSAVTLSHKSAAGFDTPSRRSIAQESPARSVDESSSLVAESVDPESKHAAAYVRMEAAAALLKLLPWMAAGVESRVVSVNAFLLTARTVMDSEKVVRTDALRLLVKCLASSPLPLRWMAVIPAAVLEPTANVRRINKDAITKAFAMFRKSARAAGKAAAPSPTLIVEYSLPLAVFCAAHGVVRMPDAASAATTLTSRASGTTEAWGGLQQVAAYLGSLLDAVLSSLSADVPAADAALATVSASSASMMFAILSKLKMCEDAVDPTRTKSLHQAADVAFLVLKSKCKDQRAFATFPGDVMLPSSMFRTGAVPARVAGAAVLATPMAATRQPQHAGKAVAAATAGTKRAASSTRTGI